MDPVQEGAPKVPKFSQEQQKQVDLEVKTMLEKLSISNVCHLKREFYSSLFLISKKDGGNHAVKNLKDLNQFIPYKHFKMEGLQKYVLQKWDYMCKTDLKDAYFSVPLHKDWRNLVRFLWGRKLVWVSVPMLWFGTSSHNIHKIIKGSNLSFETSDDNDYNLSRRFIDFRKHMSEMFTARDSVIFLLQHPGFVIPLKKCVLYPVQEIELLGLILNSHTMTL